MTESAEEYQERLQATEEDPWLSVHAVSQHLFCHRAGVITHENREEDTGYEGRSIRLGYLPRYDLRAIESLVGRWITASVIGTITGALTAASLCLGAWLLDPRLLVLAVAVFLAMVVGVLVVSFVVVLLLWRLTGAKQASPQEPEFQTSTATIVDWWGLQAAGFESQHWPGALKAESWRLAGKPWGMLVRGRQYIPVFFDRSDRVRLEKKHYARIAAYCLLLQREAGVESPFGVILRPGTTKVEAIPSTFEAASALADGVEELRRSLASVAENPLYATPAQPHLCAKCPLGELKPIEELPQAPNGGARVHVKTTKGLKNSVCGVRFQWSPPHESAVLNGRT